MVEEPKKEDNWYRPALFFYAKVTGWIVVPLVLAVVVNRYTGSQFLFFILLAIAFIFTIYGIYREIKVYKKEIEQ